MHPYKDLPETAFWSKSVSTGFNHAHIFSPILSSGDKVMSAGSCFASNIVPYLESAGFEYVRSEKRPAGFTTPPENLGYDKFSAAYGNVYTARQLLQLLQRATDKFRPIEPIFEEDGYFVDAFRPGLRYKAKSRRELALLTNQHFDATLTAVRKADTFIFTLGLTEAWIDIRDGSVFPSCPGTISGAFSPENHGFHNFTATEITNDLLAFIDLARLINPLLRLVLTVSPVPLVATASGHHVLEATIYSKSVLRVAAQSVVGQAEDVHYFPAYEIVTGPQAPADFFEPDRRNVSKAAIDVVMSTFLGSSAAEVRQPAAERLGSLSEAFSDFECEEVAIGR